VAPIAVRTSTLADGRELIWFDDADTALGSERRVDARVLDPRPETASMRQDPLTGDWVSIAASRQNRVFLPPAELDPLAPASETNPSEIPDVYDVAVFENRSPSFGPSAGARSSASAPTPSARSRPSATPAPAPWSRPGPTAPRR
jgi:UDPglucose--hexose-1-phosphate uridylyltransferase